MSLLLESNLILLRHGQSVWNSEPSRFTGWCDVPLTVKGRVEAVSVGQLLRARGFRAANVDVAFTSELQRAHETCELALASMAGHEQDTWSSERIRRDVRLNERHYGAVQGLYKDDPALRAAHGEERIRRWRRSMDARPPPLNDQHPEWRPPPAPTTEALADCQRRAACNPTSQSLIAMSIQGVTLCASANLLPPPSPPPPPPPSARRVVECFEERIAPALFDCGDAATGGWTPQSTDRTAAKSNEAKQGQQGRTPSVGSARPRLLRLGARLAALGGPALPGGETEPLRAQPSPRVLEPAASKVADVTALGPAGTVVVVAHANTIRSLMAYFDEVG